VYLCCIDQPAAVHFSTSAILRRRDDNMDIWDVGHPAIGIDLGGLQVQACVCEEGSGAWCLSVCVCLSVCGVVCAF